MAHQANADAIVIGAGVTGLSTALHLKALGVRRVVVVERHYAGAGQSGRAAGVVRALVAHPQVSAMLLESLRFFAEFGERFGETLEIDRIGYLLIAAADQEHRIGQALRASVISGCKAARIGAREAAELQPGLGAGDECVFAFEPDAIWTDPMPAVQAFARAARAAGIELREGCEVKRVLHNGREVEGIEADSGPIYAPAVLVCTAAWGARLLAGVGVTVPVVPHRIEMAFFQRAPREPRRLGRILSDVRSRLYLRPEGAAQMFVGWREGDRIRGMEDLQAVDPDHYRQTAEYASLAEMHRRLAVTLPFMQQGFVHRTYACVYDYTPDAMPILDRVPGLRGLHYALGFSGGGFSLSPWVGRMMAECAATGTIPTGMELLDANRFRENRLVDWSNAGAAALGRA